MIITKCLERNGGKFFHQVKRTRNMHLNEITTLKVLRNPGSHLQGERGFLRKQCFHSIVCLGEEALINLWPVPLQKISQLISGPN